MLQQPTFSANMESIDVGAGLTRDKPKVQMESRDKPAPTVPAQPVSLSDLRNYRFQAFSEIYPNSGRSRIVDIFARMYGGHNMRFYR